MARFTQITLVALFLTLPLVAQHVAVPLEFTAPSTGLVHHYVDGNAILDFVATPPADGQIFAVAALMTEDGSPMMSTAMIFWSRDLVGGADHELQVPLSPALAGMGFYVQAVFHDVNDDFYYSSDVHQIVVLPPSI